MRKSEHKRGKMGQLPGDIPISAKIELIDGSGDASRNKAFRKEVKAKMKAKSDKRLDRIGAED